MSETIWSQASPTGVSGYATTTENGTYGVYFTVDAASTLTAIWFYSPSGATSLPTATALYSTTSTPTSGTLLASNSSPSWSGAAGSGWVRDNSFPATALSTGTIYVGAYYGASFKQGYIYTGAAPAAWFPSSSPSGLITAPEDITTTLYCNAPYLNSSNAFPSTAINGANINWLADVEVSAGGTGPAQIAGPAQYQYQPPAWHPASGPGMPGGEPFAVYPPAPYALAVAPVTVPAGPWRLFPSTSGPGTATSNSGSLIVGASFQVTQGVEWFQGFWWWCCGSGQSTSPVKCALWNAGAAAGGGAFTGSVVSGSVVTSGTLTAGQWNWIPLSAPVQLAIGTVYIAAIGTGSGNYPDTAAQFGSGDPYSAGIQNGPLDAFSAQNGTNASGYTAVSNGMFTTAGTDPSTSMPNQASTTYDNYWVDVQVTSTAPGGFQGPFQLWPNNDYADPYISGDAAINYAVGTEFWLSQPCTVNEILYFSLTGTAQLATAATIWNVVTQQPVYTNSSPSWSGAAGSGWVSCPVSGVTLQPGTYRVTVFNGNGSPDSWSAKRLGYWGYYPSGGPLVTASGITNGPIFAPSAGQANNAYEYDISNAGGTPPYSYPDGRQEPAQSVFAQSGSNSYPSLYVDGLYQNYWVDISVTSAAPVAGTASISGQGALGTSAATGAGESLNGQGALGTPDSAVQAGATLAGAGTLVTAATEDAGATLAGTGSLGTPDVTEQAPATLAGAGALATAVTESAPATITGQGVLATAATQAAGATIAGAGQLATAATEDAPATLSGAGQLGTPDSSEGAGGTLGGQGSLGPADSIIQVPATITGQGNLAASTSPSGAGSLTGQGSLAAPAVQGAGMSIAGQGQLTDAASEGSGVSLAGGGSLGQPASAQSAAALITGAGSLSGTGTSGGGQGATMTGGGQLGAPVTIGAPATMAGQGSITAAGTVPGALPPLPDGITAGKPYSRWSAGQPYSRWSAADPHG